MPRHTVRDRSCRAALYRKSLCEFRRPMMLQGVVSEMLLALGEHHPVDLATRPLPDQLDVLIDFRQTAADGTVRPLQGRIAIDDRPLLGKVPDAVPPVLQVHIPQMRARGQQQLDAAAMQTARFLVQAFGLLQQRGLRPLFQHHQRVPQVHASGLEDRQRVERFLHNHAAGDVEEMAARPESRVQRGELVVTGNPRRDTSNAARPGPPAARTSSSRLPKSTPWEANAGFSWLCCARLFTATDCPASCHADIQQRLGSREARTASRERP